MNMKHTIYEKLKTPIGKLTELKISIDYELGGYSYFYSQKNQRGVYIYIKPVNHGENGFEESVMLGDTKSSGFKICVEELTRKSQKAIDSWHKKISIATAEITELYEQEKYDDIVKLINSL